MNKLSLKILQRRRLVLTMRLINIPEGADRLEWMAHETSDVLLIHFEDRLSITPRRKWGVYDEWDTIQGMWLQLHTTPRSD